jgi:5-oxoprolinase (ATP-hydrolysing)
LKTTADPGAAAAGGWRIWIDRGGTFTDVVALDPAGQLWVRKVLSVQPGDAGDPAVRAMAGLLELAPAEPIPASAIRELRLGTTVATNALLEHRGAPVVLLINQGLADLISIGDLHRPDLFALAVQRPTPLEHRVIEVPGRLAADGSELEPLRCDESLHQRLVEAVADGYRSVAIALLHSTVNNAHEQQLATWVASLGLELEAISLSHRISPLPRLVPRGQTTLVEAALAPVLDRYLDQLEAALAGAVSLRVMRSSGALAPRPWLLAKDTILSGPAGGMVGALAVARQALQQAGLPLQPVVGCDMGGTSTDVFHAACQSGDWAWQRSAETDVAGLQLQAPMLPIHTVAAGGGSIVRFDGERLQVGPASAGADPGPAAYGRGGPLTITDANVVLGRLPEQALPPVFGPGGDQPLDRAVVTRGFADLAKAMAVVRPGLTAEQAAAGALQITVETMAAAVRRISIEQGHDPRAALLVSYGGAAAQHACRLADELGLQRVLVHPLAGVLSAYGIGMAPQSLLLQRSLAMPLRFGLSVTLRALVANLVAEGEAELARVTGPAQLPPVVTVRLELRQPGQVRGLEIPWPGPVAADGADATDLHDAAELAQLRSAYGDRHQQRYGYRGSADDLVVEQVLVEVQAVAAPHLALAAVRDQAPMDLAPVTTRLWIDAHQGWQDVPLWQRAQLHHGQGLHGPALVLDATTTLVLEPGWQLRCLADGALLLETDRPAQRSIAAGLSAAAVDPVLLELYHHRFAAIAVQMGVQLQQSACSLNIRERLDYSCAVFDQHGALVANAPHIPVHLGSMGDSVVSLLEAVARRDRAPLAPGDVVVSNNPYNGGTHLPDITAITPVFAPGAARGSLPLFFVASRGHHADVGGITPGSMPASSHSIEDEGLLLDNEPFLVNGDFDASLWRARLAQLPHPVRNAEQLLADLQAQAAANRTGAKALAELIARQGLAEVQAYMGHVQANAAAAVGRLLVRLSDGRCTLKLDHGARICVAVQVDRAARRMCIDFSGTSHQHDGNLNAPLAVTKAAVLYVVRALVAEPIPLNAGCFAPITLIAPAGSLLNPLPPAAVVAGNVEISQAIANALLAALGQQAASQGTMNNLCFGNGESQYYETIGGGCGAGPGFPGGSAVQSHMTNSRLTDPEVLEARLPVRLEQFAIRRGSGGRGRWPGGDGVIRQLRFVEPMVVSLISGSRRVAPPGLAGGGAGSTGHNSLISHDGLATALPGCFVRQFRAGEALRIETPGGGGFGTPN